MKTELERLFRDNALEIKLIEIVRMYDPIKQIHAYHQSVQGESYDIQEFSWFLMKHIETGRRDLIVEFGWEDWKLGRYSFKRPNFEEQDISSQKKTWENAECLCFNTTEWTEDFKLPRMNWEPRHNSSRHELFTAIGLLNDKSRYDSIMDGSDSEIKRVIMFHRETKDKSGRPELKDRIEQYCQILRKSLEIPIIKYKP
jgi:hypothetical protein